MPPGRLLVVRHQRLLDEKARKHVSCGPCFRATGKLSQSLQCSSKMSVRTAGEINIKSVSSALVLLVGTMSFVPLMADKPNVILVMSDDQGWTQTGYYGHPIAKTPNLDDMA